MEMHTAFFFCGLKFQFMIEMHIVINCICWRIFLFGVLVFFFDLRAPQSIFQGNVSEGVCSHMLLCLCSLTCDTHRSILSYLLHKP